MVDFTLERKEEMISSLVEKLPTIRQEMNISQTELGEMVGLSRQSISAVERGVSKLSWNNYLAIMLFLIANKDKCSVSIEGDGDELMETIGTIDLK